ncbi:vicilin-like seed storage protein At2g28490 [Brachypodium distachyon]|nr:vicilin-like seed storage protein At2g28490 [Brachypodium distachyon]|eukprot:XP_003557965.1 vicilin-like seed storage protein At2g28490 [Brachypodium distachyon]
MDRCGVVVMTPLLTLLLLLSGRSAMGAPRYRERWEQEGPEWRPDEEGKGGKGLFLLDNVEKVVDSEGGQVHVVRGPFVPEQPWQQYGACREGLMHIGFITMEPKTLFVPQYIDSNLILFVQRGEVKIGWIHNDELVQKQLKMGDVLHIEAGATFYMVNTGKGQRLQIICSIDASDSPIGLGPYQSFFLTGGGNPTSVLAGFDPKMLVTAFNTTYDEVARLFRPETRGPFVSFGTEPGSGGKERGQREEEGDAGNKEEASRKAGPWRPVGRGDDEERDDEQSSTWSWRKLMGSFIGFGGASNDAAQLENKKDKTVRAPEPYNLFDHEPGFRNAYGWSVSVDKHAYEPLDHSDIGVYLVNLTAGSMMAPHVNPRATEYGVVLGGEGEVQVVFPNGSLAMSARVRPGDVFWIPRYFPFAQVASRSGPFEFFGFTTSARRNKPQFLVGANSLLRTMLGPELAAGFGVPEKELGELMRAQKEAVILSSLPEKEEKGREQSVIKQVAKE